MTEKKEEDMRSQLEREKCNASQQIFNQKYREQNILHKNNQLTQDLDTKTKLLEITKKEKDEIFLKLSQKQRVFNSKVSK